MSVGSRPAGRRRSHTTHSISRRPAARRCPPPELCFEALALLACLVLGLAAAGCDGQREQEPAGADAPVQMPPPGDQPPDDDPPGNAPPIGDAPGDDPPVQMPPPGDAPPNDDPPRDDPPNDTPPVDEPPVEDPPVTDPAVITAVAPALASASGATVVAISTSGFAEDFGAILPTVTFGGAASTGVTALDATTLAAEVPALPAGEVDVAVVGSAFTASFAGFAIVPAVTAGEVIVNELLPNPGGTDANRDGTASNADDEFVELVNTRPSGVDLSGYTLGDATSLRHTFPNPTTLPGGGSLVVFAAGDLAESSPPFAVLHATGHAQVTAGGSLGLNNGGDTVTLADPLGVVIDTASFAASTPAASLNRDPDGTPDAVLSPHGAVDGHVPDPGTGAELSPGLRVDQTAW